MDSILTHIKKMLGVTEEYTPFDVDIITFINTSFSILNQIGVGPPNGFSISDDTSVWTEFEDGPVLDMVKTFVLLNVRLMFDPPSSSAVMTSMQNQINELTWRLNK